MSSPAERNEERISVGLIEYLSRHTLDEDYAWVTRNRPDTGGRGTMVALVATLGVLGLLLFTAASQTTRNAGSQSKQRDELISQANSSRSDLNGRLLEARRITAENQGIARNYALGSGPSAALQGTVRRLSTLSGLAPVKGPGARLKINDAVGATSDRERVLDRDLQRLVNGLWAAGAEAISVNGQRISTLTSIRQAGGAINVNFVPLRAPYTLLAIGDERNLPSRFAETASGAAWLDLVQQVGLRFSIHGVGSLSLPALKRPQLRYAEPTKGGTR